MATTSAQADLDVFVRAILKLKKTGKEKKQIEALVGQIFSQVKDTTKNLNIKINPNLNFDLKGINQQIAAQKAKVDAAISQTFQERKGGPFAGKKKSELQGLSSTLGGFNQILDPVVQKGKGLTFSDSVTKTLDAMAAGTTRFSQLSSAQQSVVKDHVGFMQEQAKGLAVANKFLEKQGITLFSDKAAKSEFRRFQKDTRELTRQVNAGEIAGANNAAQRSEALFARSSQIVKRLGGDLAKDQAGAFSKLSLDDALSVDRGIAARLGLVKREVDALADAGVNAGASFKSAEKELNLLTKQRDTLKQVRSAKTLPVGQTIKAQEKLELAREDQLKKQLKLASELGKFDPSTATNKQAQALKALQVEAGDALTAVSKLSKGNQAFRKDVKAAADEQLLQNRAVRDNISLVRAREITSGKPSQKRDDLSVSEATQRQKALDRVSQAERSVKEARSPSRIKGAEAVPLTKNELTNLKSATNELGAANKALQGTYRGASQEAIEGQRKTTAAINQTKASVKALDGDLTASTQRQKQAAQLRQGRGVIKNIGGVENVGQEFGGLSVSDQKAVAATLAQKKTTLGKQEGRLISAGATNENSKFNASLVRTQSELAKAQQAIDSITKSTEKYQTTTQQAGQVLRQFLKFAIGYAVLFKAIGAIQALVSGLIQLDKRLVSISAIAQTTPAELDEIATAIQRVATTTQFSTSEIAEAAQVLSQAGVNPSEIAQSLSSVADLAAATNSALSVSADLVSTIRNVFTELDDRTIADQLTKAVNISKLTTNDLQTILSRSGQVSKAFNISSAQLLASATVLRNAGIKASTVSTGLRQGILEVLSPDAKTIKVLKGRYKALGEELSEADIKSKFFGFASDPTPLISALKELRRLGAGGSGALDFRRVFDIRAENVINALIKNLGDVEKNLTSLSSGGSAARGAERQLDSLANSFDNMNAAITAFTANLTGGMLPALAQVFQFLTKVITQLDSLQTKFVSEKGVGIESFGILSGLAGIAVGGRARRGALARADPKASPSQKLLNSGAATVVGLGAGLGTVAGITAGGVAGVALADAVGADEEITAAITLGTSAAGGAIAA
ncbi:MAG: phage tail tape measure protein, partial [Gammaproteobacteria bacterium]|nr:phage tail tape measure protein [Gammaproteobacteria bacterium]